MAEEVRIDLLAIRAQVDSALAQTNLLTLLNDCYIPSRCLPSNYEVPGKWSGPLSPLQIHVLRNSIHPFEYQAAPSDIWSTNRWVAS